MQLDLGCVIYVDAERDELEKLLREVFPESNPANFYFNGYANELEIVRNLDFQSAKRQEFPDGFLHFRQRLEIFPDESNPPSL